MTFTMIRNLLDVVDCTFRNAPIFYQVSTSGAKIVKNMYFLMFFNTRYRLAQKKNSNFIDISDV